MPLLEAGAEQILLGQELLEVPRELSRGVDLGGTWGDALLGQLAHEGTQLVMLGRGQIGHAGSSKRGVGGTWHGVRSLAHVPVGFSRVG